MNVHRRVRGVVIVCTLPSSCNRLSGQDVERTSVSSMSKNISWRWPRDLVIYFYLSPLTLLPQVPSLDDAFIDRTAWFGLHVCRLPAPLHCIFFIFCIFTAVWSSFSDGGERRMRWCSSMKTRASLTHRHRYIWCNYRVRVRFCARHW